MDEEGCLRVDWLHAGEPMSVGRHSHHRYYNELL